MPPACAAKPAYTVRMGLFSGRIDASITTPCTANWHEMKGDDRVRFCEHCQKQVHNFSALTPGEARTLVSQTSGRFCAMLARNRDGSLALQHSHWRRAAQRLITAATLGWASSTLAAQPPATAHTELVQLRPKEADARLAGMVIDITGAGVGGARVTLQAADANQQAFKTLTDEKGAFSFAVLSPGTYQLQIESPGFAVYRAPVTLAGTQAATHIQATLSVGSMGGAVATVGPRRSVLGRLTHPFRS